MFHLIHLIQSDFLTAAEEVLSLHAIGYDFLEGKIECYEASGRGEGDLRVELVP
jgi:hypothetical protein